MKISKHISGLLSLLLLVAACDDNIKTVGLSTMPEGDDISVSANTIYLDDSEAQTVSFDSIYFGAKTQQVYLLGNFYDPAFGSLKGDYACQFFYSSFPDSIKNNWIDSVKLEIYYNAWLGDSLALMEVSAYPVRNDANFDDIPYRYTNINLRDRFVASGAKPWASKLYTSFDRSVSDSIYTAGYSKHITMDISNVKIEGTNIGEYFLSPWLIKRDTLQSIPEFSRFFKGLYVTTTSGEGNIIGVTSTKIRLHYVKVSIDDDNNTKLDTTYSDFNTAPETRVSCQYRNDNEDLTKPDENTTYIKSPAGVYTQYTLPIQKIIEETEGREINSVRFSITTYPQDDWLYALTPPTTLMLIRKDSLTSFFESSKIIAEPTAYKATYSSYRYDFGDISSMVRQAVKEGKSTLDVMLVPVTEGQFTSYYGTISMYTAYDIIPSGVKLRKGKEFLKLDILSSRIGRKK